jgi:hypothetical protein
VNKTSAGWPDLLNKGQTSFTNVQTTITRPERMTHRDKSGKKRVTTLSINLTTLTPPSPLPTPFLPFKKNNYSEFFQVCRVTNQKLVREEKREM